MNKPLSFFGKLLIVGMALFASCDNDDPIAVIDKPKPVENKQANVNANPKYLPELTRLEMPRLHGGTDTLLIHRTTGGVINYITEWDFRKKSQRWSCYVLDRDYMQSRTSRYYNDTNQYPQDEVISTTLQWQQDPYRGNPYRYDHGHICPSADRLYSEEANYQTFYLTNMQPQFNSFNAGIWAKLEGKVRTIAGQSDTLYVCKGGTIDEGTYGAYNKVYQTLSNGLIVPRYFFMALLRKKNGNYSAIGIWTDQVINANDNGSNLAQYAISIDELEKRTGIDFFCNLPDATENEAEKTYGSFNAWGLY